MTGFVPVMWAVWAVLVIIVLGLKIYTGKLSQNEDNQLVLASSSDNLKAEQAEMIGKVKKIAPLRNVMLGLSAAMTVVVIGHYALDVVNQFK
jgi:hypothetical protein